MFNSSTHRLLLPETIWLETEDYERANKMSNGLASEQQRWQTYLNLLALFSLKTWLTERLPNQKITRHVEINNRIYYLQVGDFTITAIAVENLLDERIRVSSQQLNNHPTHFYTLLEINEESEEVIFRGLLRRDFLDTYLAEKPNLQLSNGNYSLPLSWFDSEPNHLLAYCQHLSPQAIALPIRATESSLIPEVATTTNRTKLIQWLQDTLIEGWSAIETLINPEMNLALSTRSIAKEYKKGKLINLGIDFNCITMALLVAVKEEADCKLGVNIQLYPTSREQYLPAGVQLSLLSKAGKTLQSVQARKQDNYIQLKPFRGKPGKHFSLEIIFEGVKVREYFEL